MELPPLDSDRRETPTERLDRNGDELLQELRVTQTDVQLLAGFLLTVPFQQRFATITDSQRMAYLVALGAAIWLVIPLVVRRRLTPQ